MSSPKFVPSDKPSHHSSPSGQIFGMAHLTKARLSFSTSPTPDSRKRGVSDRKAPSPLGLSNSSGPIGTFQSQSVGGLWYNVTQVSNGSPESQDGNETTSKSRARFHSDIGDGLQRSEQQFVMEDEDIASSPFNLHSSTPNFNGYDYDIDDEYDRDNHLHSDGIEDQARQEELEDQAYQDQLASFFVADPFLTFQAIAEEYPINSNIIDPNNNLRRCRLITEIHQRVLKALADQAARKANLSSAPLSSPSLDPKMRVDSPPRTPPSPDSRDRALENSRQTLSSSDFRDDSDDSPPWTPPSPSSGKRAFGDTPPRTPPSLYTRASASGNSPAQITPTPASRRLVREISPLQSPTTTLVPDLTQGMTVVEERLVRCRFCLEAGFDQIGREDVDGSLLDCAMVDTRQDVSVEIASDLAGVTSTEGVLMLNSETLNGALDGDVPLYEMVDSCDVCRNCQIFNDEYEWLMEASRAHFERYGDLDANTDEY